MSDENKASDKDKGKPPVPPRPKPSTIDEGYGEWNPLQDAADVFKWAKKKVLGDSDIFADVGEK